MWVTTAVRRTCQVICTVINRALTPMPWSEVSCCFVLLALVASESRARWMACLSAPHRAQHSCHHSNARHFAQHMRLCSRAYEPVPGLSCPALSARHSLYEFMSATARTCWMAVCLGCPIGLDVHVRDVSMCASLGGIMLVSCDKCSRVACKHSLHNNSVHYKCLWQTTDCSHTYWGAAHGTHTDYIAAALHS